MPEEMETMPTPPSYTSNSASTPTIPQGRESIVEDIEQPLPKVKPIKLDPMYVAKFPDFDVEVPADAHEYIELLKKMFPDEANGIDGLFKDQEDMLHAMNGLMDLSSGSYWPTIKDLFMNPGRYFKLAVAWRQNLDQFLDKHTQDKKLRAVFTQLAGFAGASPEEDRRNVFG